MYVYFRKHEHELVMVLINNNFKPVSVDLDRFHEVLGSRKKARSVASGLDYDLTDNMSIKKKTVVILDAIF